MSSTDERVVSLKFDNAQFEKNTKQSIDTLNNLDAAVEKAGAAKGLTELGETANNIDLSTLSKNVESVAHRFSTLGIIGMTAIQTITNGVMGLGAKMVSQIARGGLTRALNIEQAKFQIEGLKGVWDQTSKGYVKGMKTIKDAVNNAVTDTAYGLDEAAKIGSQLMASGITEADTLEKHLKSVSGLAAMTGGSYEDIGRIFTQVAGQGRLMGEQLNQISARGINAAATLKDYLNGNKKAAEDAIENMRAMGKSGNLVGSLIDKYRKGIKWTEGDIRDMVSQSGISFEIFSNGMNEAFGKHAKEANKTFTGSLANMKAALSRIGAEFASPGITNFRDIFNSLTPLINAVHEAMMPFVNSVVSGMDKSTKAVTRFLKALVVLDKEGHFKAFGGVERIAKKLTNVLGAQDAKNIADTWGGIAVIFRTIKKLLTNLFNVSKSGLHTVISFVLSITGAVGRFLMFVEKSAKDLTIVSGIFNVIKSTLSGVFNVLKSVIDLATRAISSLGASPFPNIVKDMEHGAEILQNVQKIITNVFGGISKAINGAFSDISKATSNGNTNGLIDILQAGFFSALGVGIVSSLNNIKKLIKNVGGLVNKVKDAVENFDKSKNVLNDLHKILKAYQHSIKAKIIMDIAIAMGVLAASLFVISKIDSDKLTSSLVALGAIFIEFVAAFTILTRFADAKGLKAMAKLSLLSTAMITFSVAVLILASAVKVLSTLSWDELARGLTGLVVILASISLFANSLSKLEKGIFKASASLIVLGIALNIIAKAVVSLGQLDTEHLLVGLSGIMALLVGISAFLSQSGSYSLSVKTSIALMVISASLYILSDAVKKLASMDLESIGRSLMAIGVLLLEIAIFSTKMSEIKGFVDPSIAFGAIATSIAVLATGLKKLGGLSWEKISRGLLTFTAVITIATVALKGIDSFKSIGAATGLILVAAAFRVFIPLLERLGKLPIKVIATSLLYLVGTLTALSVTAKLLSVAAGAMSKLALSIMLLGAGLGAAGAGMFLFATGLTLLAASAEAILASVPTLVTAIVQGIKQFLAEAMSFIPSLIQLGMEFMIGFLKGMKENIPLMVELTADIVIEFLKALTEKIPEIVDAGFDFIGAFIEGIVKGISDFSNRIKDGVNSISAETFEVVSRALLEISGAVFLLSRINPVGAIKAVLALIIFANGLSILLTELGAINKIPGVQDFLNGGVEILGILGSAIGTFVGNLVGSLGAGLTKSLPDMGKNLSGFMKNIKPFIDGAKGIDEGVGESIKNIASAILYLTGAKFIDSLAVFAGSNTFAEFGKQLNEFAPGFKEFANSTKDLDQNSIKGVKTVSEVIKSLAESAKSIPNEGGLLAKIVGDNKLSTFSEGLVSMAEDIGEVANILNKYEIGPKTCEKIINFAGAVKAIAEMAQEIPNTGGLVSKFTGDNTLGPFAEQLVDFAQPLVDFVNTIKGVESWDSIKNAADAMIDFAKFAEAIPNTGGLVSKFTGDNKLSTFGKQLADFAPNLVDFVNGLAGVKEGDAEKVKAMVPIMNAISEMASSLPNVGGIAGEWAGDSILSNETFGDNLVSLGKTINKIAKGFSKIENPEAVQNAVPLIKAFGVFIKALPETGGISGDIFGDVDLDEWSNKLGKFGSGIKEFADNIAGAKFDNVEAVSKLITSLSNMASASEDFDPSNFSKITTALKGEGEETTFGSAIKSFCEDISGVNTDGLSEISTLITSLAKAAKKSDGVSFDGLNDLTKNLPKIGTRLSKFSANIGKDFDGSKAKQAAEVVKSLSSVVDSFSKFTTTTRKGNSTSASFDSKTFDSFADSLGKISKKIKTFAEEMQNIETEGLDEKAEAVKTFLDTVATAISKATKKLNKKGKQGINKFLEGFTNVKASSSGLSNVSSQILKAMGSPNYKSFSNAGKDAMAKFVSGLTKGGNLSNAKKAGSSLYEKVKAGANKSLYATGQNVGQGFVDGIKNKTSAAYNAGASLYNQAKQAIKDKSDQNSPSKDAMKLGGFVGEGFVIGISKYNEKAYSAGEEITGSMFKGIERDLTSDFSDPIIKPVVDLSDVKKGASQIGGMFDSTSINPAVIPQIQNRQNRADETERLVSAINKMSSDIVQNNTNRGDTYNIGDVTLDVSDLKDVLTLDQLVAVIKKAKAFN